MVISLPFLVPLLCTGLDGSTLPVIDLSQGTTPPEVPRTGSILDLVGTKDGAKVPSTNFPTGDEEVSATGQRSETDRNLASIGRVDTNIGDSLPAETDSGVSVEDVSSRVTTGLEGVPIPSTQLNSSVAPEEVTPPMPAPDKEDVGDVLEPLRGEATSGASSESSRELLSYPPPQAFSSALPQLSRLE